MVGSAWHDLRGSCIRGLRALLALLFVLLTWCPLGAPSQRQPAHMQRWFNHLDSDKDGQLQQQELRRFVGANLGPTDFNTQKKLDAAVEQITGKLDGSDSGLDISISELDQYLHRILEGVKVSDWIAHSLGLPQYAQTFKDNAITVLDFPMLVNDGGKLLETELMVTRVLHRHKIIKAMQRQMLGLGSEPGPIQQLACTAHSSSSDSGDSARTAKLQQRAAAKPSLSPSTNNTVPAGTAVGHVCIVQCGWGAPAVAGEPALHKYVLERFALLQPGAMWETAAELDDSVITRFNDAVRQPGLYQYRLAAWNLYGRSPYVLSSEVTVDQCIAAEAGDLKHPAQHPARMHQQQSAGANLTAAAAAAQTDQLQGLQGPSMQLQSAAATGLLGKLKGSQHVMGQPPKQQHWMQWSQQQQHQQQPHMFPIATDATCQLPSWERPNGDSCDTAMVVHASCESEPSLPHDTQTSRSDAAAAAAKAGGGAVQGPNVVWLVGQGALTDGPVPATAAAVVAQAQLLATMQAAALDGATAASGGGSSSSSSTNTKTAATARATKMLGPVGSQLWQWIRAGLNSLVLLVLPLLVRLLPVPLLNKLACAAARAIQLLPLQVQQLLLQLAPSIRQPVTHSAAAAASNLSAHGLGEIEPGMAPSAAAPAAAIGPMHVESRRGQGATAGSSPVAAMRALHHTVSAPAVTAVDSAAFGCPGVLPDHAAAFGLSASQSVGALPRMQPAASSSALSAAAAAPGQQQQVGILGHMKNSLDALGISSAAAAAGGFALAGMHESEGCIAAAAAGARASASGSALPAVHSQGSFEQCGLQLVAALEHQGPIKKRCAFPGCHQQFDLRHFKALRQRHYCGRCQQAFCLQHTAYSPHGASGSCGAESRCVCVNCFLEFTPEYRMFLNTRNTLVSRRALSGPPRDADSSSGSSGDAGSSGSDIEGPRVSSGVGRMGILPVKLLKSASAVAVAAGQAAGPDSSSSSAQQQGLGLARGVIAAVGNPGKPLHRTVSCSDSRSAVTAVASSAACEAVAGISNATATSNGSSSSRADQIRETAGSVMGKMLWARGIGKAKAVVRFKQAGQQHKH